MFPVMLSLDGRRCLVVGGGGVALRKVLSLLEEGARVDVVAPDIVPKLQEMALDGRVKHFKREYRPGEAVGYSLVFAATDDREVNATVFRDADGDGIWVNVADDPEICSFHLPARMQRSSLQIAVASGGEAPFVVRRLRKMLEHSFGEEWGEWLDAAARFRERVYSLDLNPAEQAACFDLFFEGTVDRNRWTARVPSITEEEKWCAAGGTSGETEQAVCAGSCDCHDHDIGLVSLVGAGPGCAGLLTIRGRDRMMRADAVVYDRLASPALPCDLPADVELHCVGKQAGHHPVPQEEINAILIRLAKQGKRVVRLKGGDPYVFGRGGEEAEALAAENIPFETVPGVTSGIAAPGWAGIPVTHRKEAVRLTLLTAHESQKADGPQVRWDLLAQDPHATLVGYMGVTALPQVVKSLIEGGMDRSTPAALVERGTTAAQRSVISTLENLPADVERNGLRPPALFVIGPTVGHADRLNWVSRKPLSGQRLVVTEGNDDLVFLLELAGADIVAVPEQITPAARTVMGASRLSGVVFRNPEEVDTLDEEREQKGWSAGMTAWCIGPQTARRALETGWQRVKQLPVGLDCAGLVDGITRSRD